MTVQTPVSVGSDTAVKSDILTANDRCDACNSAQAYVRVVLAAGAPLQFCAHHTSINEEKLRAVAVEFIDERWKLA